MYNVCELITIAVQRQQGMHGHLMYGKLNLKHAVLALNIIITKATVW